MIVKFYTQANQHSEKNIIAVKNFDSLPAFRRGMVLVINHSPYVIDDVFFNADEPAMYIKIKR